MASILTQYSKSVEAEHHVVGLREDMTKLSTELQQLVCGRDNLENRVRGIEDYLPLLVSWAEETTRKLDRLSHAVKKNPKKTART